MKASLNANIPIRTDECHKHALPEFLNVPIDLTGLQEDEKTGQARAIKHFFTILRKWQERLSPKALINVLKADVLHFDSILSLIHI